MLNSVQCYHYLSTLLIILVIPNCRCGDDKGDGDDLELVARACEKKLESVDSCFSSSSSHAVRVCFGINNILEQTLAGFRKRENENVFVSRYSKCFCSGGVL